MDVELAMNTENIHTLINKLQKLRQVHICTAKDVVGETLFKDDLYYLSLIDKSMRIIDGFIDALKNRNLTCMGIFLRVQMDNCMRTYATYIAENPSSVFESIMGSDIQLNHLTDKSGNKMTDSFLKKQLESLEPRFSKVYREASGYIHHSEKAFFNIATTTDENVLNLNVGHPLESIYDSAILDCTQAFIHFIRFQIKITMTVIQSKKKCDANNP